jgi:hypothetical protein
MDVGKSVGGKKSRAVEVVFNEDVDRLVGKNVKCVLSLKNCLPGA